MNRGNNNKCKSTIAYRHGASSRRALAVSVDENYGRISVVEIAPPQRIRVRDVQRRSAIRVPPAKQRISTRSILDPTCFLILISSYLVYTRYSMSRFTSMGQQYEQTPDGSGATWNAFSPGMEKRKRNVQKKKKKQRS